MSSKCKKCRQMRRLERKLEETQMLLFAAVRAATLPIGLKLGKTEKEISEKTFETIVEMKNTVDFAKIRRSMLLADWKETEDDTEA